MDLSIPLTGRRVLVIGTAVSARRVVARCAVEGADVRLVPAHSLPPLTGRFRRPAADLVVWVEGDTGIRARLEQECRRLGIWFTAESPVTPVPRGHVTLVGGGPGDPDLMTVAGRRALADADVVLFDRLAPREDLERWAPGAELIDVGKTPGHHAVPQHEIEALMVHHALRGLRVVRLKGGDPFVFGRGGEEVAACRAAGVPVSVVPGVTSAISVPGSVGIPVTHREISRSFTVVSGHAPFSENELTHLAGIGGTLVVLMGVNTLPHLVAGLRRNGMGAEVPLAIVERGFSESQRTTVTDLGGVLAELGRVQPRSPAVIVIGEVVRQRPGGETAWDTEAARAVAAFAS
ncbi:uroporphyrinogen-III C-methyltransferase [Desertivibrio insolitus]|uniref:uroporphyrinogen-III C-methyltransferase n=1 Tax=Herbiconiux sp. SYSU D00978 TaxID=2812562 RepID=UPI001A963E3F|nr:uroporphyrinogen-III C-methyltransferase [Herbiconiux sp. SYSU D00978]